MSSKRRPYLSGRASLVEFFNAPIRHLKDLVTVESAFEKPYYDAEYRKMHFDMPWPDWPGEWNWPEWPPGHWPPGDDWTFPRPPGDETPGGDPSGPIPGSNVCVIVCYPPLDCDEPIWCHPGIWCGADLHCSTCTWTVEGNVLSWGPTARPLGWGIDVWIDDSAIEGEKALVTVCMKDPCENICCEDMEVSCTVCPPDVEISWDDISSDELIGQGVGADYATAEVFVKDGLGPFKWSVSGTGFSFENSTTSFRQNTLRADNTACGMARVTVTDVCDGTATGYVRCTAAGVWCEIAFNSCVISGAITEGDNRTRIEGRYKLYEYWEVCSTVSGYGVSCDYLENYGNQGCGNAAACHNTMGCTKCLEHAHGWCRANEPVLCYAHANFICCSDTEAECLTRDCVSMCSRAVSKLYEWKCAC